MKPIIKILYLEFIAGDAAAAGVILKNAGLNCEILAINNKPHYTAALSGFVPDLIISDDALPSLQSVEALTILLENGLNIPLIVVTIPHSSVSVADVVTIMKHGAYDYISKENINTLPDAVLNAVKKHRAAQITNTGLNRYISTIDEVFFSRDMLTLELIQISRGCERVYGYSVSEFMEDTDLYGKIYHPEDKHIFPGFIASLQLGEQVSVQYRIVHKDGTIRWIESKIMPTLNESGTLVRIDGVSRDITEKKKTEDEVENSNRRIMEATGMQSAILNALPATIALLNNDGTIVSVNDSWKKFADSNGLTMPDYGIGFNYVAIAENAAGAEEAGGIEMAKGIATVVSGGQKQFTMEYPCNSPTEKRWFQVVVAPLHNKNINGAVVVHFNITERKLAEEKLQRSEEMYRLIVETAQEGIWIINENLETTFVNKKICEMLGYQPHEIIGKHNYDFKDESDKIKTFERLKNRQPGTVESHESAFITKPGKIVFCRVITNTMYDAGGKYLGLLAMLTDITRQKTDEDTLRRSEANLSAVIENTADLVYSLDTDFRVITFNQVFKNTMKQVYGFHVEQGAHALNLLNNLGPEMVAKWKDIYTRAFNAETVLFTEEYPIGNKKIYLNYSVNPIWESGKVIGLSCFSRDITRQKLDEAAIRQSEANLTAIIENTDANIYSLDAQLRYIAFNQSFKNSVLLGYKTEIKPGDKILDIFGEFDPDSALEWKNAYARAFAGKIVRFTRQFNLNNITTYYNFSINPIWENGLVIGLSCSAHNITKQKMDEIAIQKSAASLRTIFNNTELMYVLIDNQGKIASFNEPAQKFSDDQCRIIREGYPILDWVHEDRRPFVAETLMKVKSGSVVHYEANREINGSVRWLDLTWAGIKDGEQHDFGCILTIRDITEAKKLDIEREKITNELIERNKALEQFTYVISHNLRAPVANIIGLSSLVNCEDDDKSEICKIITGIGRSANKADEIISDLNHVLDINGHLNESVDSIFLPGLIDDIKFSISHLIEKERVTINSVRTETPYFFKKFQFSNFSGRC